MGMAPRLRSLLREAMARTDEAVFPLATGAAEHWQRQVMIRAVEQYIQSLGPERRSAAEISGNTHAARPWRRYTELTYPDFDLCAPLEISDRFDVVICEQVLEHVPDPWAAAENLCRMCVPGGTVIVSTPFLIKIHELALFGMWDYWRFTPRGLETLLERAGLEVVALGAWGNRQVVVGNLNRWSAYRRWHTLRNDPDLPVQVWAFARNRA